MIRPTLEEAKTLAAGYTLVPIALEIYSDIRTPMEVLKVLKAKGKNAYILESVENGENWGRYTFLGCNPSMTLTGGNGAVTVKTLSGETVRAGDPHALLKETVRGYKSPRVAYLPTFTGGFVGSFDYEYTQNGAFCLMLYRQVIAFDHLKQKIFLITNIETDNLEENYIAGVAALKDMEALVTAEGRYEAPGGQVRSEFTQSLSQTEFLRAVETCRRHIGKGEVSQVVPSVRFSAAYEGDLLPVYRALRTINPSSYMFYIQFDTMQLAAASPETLVSLKNGVVSTFPLAGTCKRTGDEEENRRLLAKLLSDPKELAEHEMLVELGREDLDKVCRPGSVNVEEYRVIKTCSHVYHIESKVRGQIRPDCDAFDAMAAALPAGTLSGAPRDKAMEIIARIEGEPRGVYGGAVGYIDFAGEMDLCIGIRMAVLKDGKVSVQAGAGIVAESIPENEYNECLNKAKAMMIALKEALT
ncbi:MAG: anthranilate synthase component I family protein [Oscillospiraceae bacterium]|nr:anthranilate synthase component I family protein [Oscillospiraceae bacterium]